MKTIFEKILFSALAVVCLSACERSSEHEDTVSDATSVLQIYTRSGDANDATVSYPVQVYVFKDGQCVAMQTIEDEDDLPTIPLHGGNYTVYAIGGASEDDYILPAQDTATVASVIALREGKSHHDLMAATANVELEDDDTESVDLTMEKVVMLLQNVTVNNLPAEVTSVTVTISPLWGNITVGATFTGEEGKETVALEKQDDGHTWKFSGEKYLLPSPLDKMVSIKVNVTTGENTKSYIYRMDELLTAGYRINFTCTYSESSTAILVGTITGATWNGEKNFSCDFSEDDLVTDDEDEEEDNGGEEEGDVTIFTETELPAVGTIYKTCYVLSVDSDVTPAKVVLLSPTQKVVGFSGKETSEEAMEKVDALLPECAVTGIKGWRVMTKSESKAFYALRKTILGGNPSYRIIYLNDSNQLNAATFGYSWASASLSATDVLRPVTTVKINIE